MTKSERFRIAISNPRLFSDHVRSSDSDLQWCHISTLEQQNEARPRDASEKSQILLKLIESSNPKTEKL